MKNLKQIKDKIKLFKDFKKVIAIQKNVLIKEIAKWKRGIEQARFRYQIFNNYLIDINNKHFIFNPNFFGQGRVAIPVKRDIHFILPSPNIEKIDEYANKLIGEYIKANLKKEDIFVVVGEDLTTILRSKGVNVIRTIDLSILSSLDNQELYQRIAFQVFQGFNDMLFHNATFIYFDIIKRRVEDVKIFPFSDKKVDLSDTKSSLDLDIWMMSNNQLKKTTYFRDISSVADNISRLAVQTRVYSAMLEYKVALLVRELHSLDDKEKNLDDEMVKLTLQMQKIRKENITNELLTATSTFGVILETQGSDRELES